MSENLQDDFEPTEIRAGASRSVWMGALVSTLVLSAFAYWGVHTTVGKRLWDRFTDWRVSPSFRGEQLGQELKNLCQRDYAMHIEARYEQKNLQAFFWKVGLFRSGVGEVRPEAFESLERVFLCATRIALSTNAAMQFIQVKMVDPMTGASISLWRYVPDIRDNMYSRFGDEEYLNRLVMEMEMEPQGNPGEWREAQFDSPMTLARFIAKQVIMRAKRILLTEAQSNIQAHEDLSNPSSLTIVIDNWSLMEQDNSKEGTLFKEAVEKAAAHVIKAYRYHDFKDVTLLDSSGSPIRSWQF